MDTDICVSFPSDAVKLCQRYQSISVDTVIITFNRETSQVHHMGSNLGEQFLNENSKIPQLFLKYCEGILDTSYTDKKIINCTKENLSPPAEDVLISKRSKSQRSKRQAEEQLENSVDRIGSKVRKLQPDNVVTQERIAQVCMKDIIIEVIPEQYVEEMPAQDEVAVEWEPLEPFDVTYISSCRDTKVESSDKDNKMLNQTNSLGKKQPRVHVDKTHHSLVKETEKINQNINLTEIVERDQDKLGVEETRETFAVPEKLAEPFERIDEPVEQSVNQRLKYSCKYCQKQFKNQKRLTRHRKIHINDTLYSCEICYENFKYKPFFISHLLLKHRSNFCPVCKLVLKDENQMKEHRFTCTAASNGEESYRCPLCCQKILSASAFDIHLNKHDQSYECDICQRSFVTLASMKRHRDTHSLTNKIHVCHLCGSRFFERKFLNGHFKTVHSIFVDTKCRLCKVNFTSNSELIEHVNSAHMSDILQKLQPMSRYTCKSSDEEMKCQVCAATFTIEYEYILHLVKHVIDNKSIFICNKCGKLFKCKSELTSHESTHKNLRPFPCEMCGQTYRSKSALTSHMHIHRDDCAFVCDMCGKGLKSRSSLRSHKRSHDKTRYFCTYCEKQFGSYDSLKGHWLAKHPNIIDERKLKVHRCEICPKVYISSQSYKKHIAQHTGVKNEECEICHGRFATVGRLRDHQRYTHFSQKKEICTVCDARFSIPSMLKKHMATSKHKEKCLKKGLDVKMFETAVEMSIKEKAKSSGNGQQIGENTLSSSIQTVKQPGTDITKYSNDEDIFEIEILSKDQAVPTKTDSENVIGYIVIDNPDNGQQGEVTELDKATTEAIHSILK